MALSVACCRQPSVRAGGRATAVRLTVWLSLQLHLATLPTFADSLPPSDVERLIQMLTVPYLRIPLVLSFFADESRLSALADKVRCPLVPAACAGR